MSRASDDLLDLLHGTIAEELLQEIKAYKDGEYVDKEGNALPIPASLLAQAIKFLKDNGVDTAVRPKNTVDYLAKELDDEFQSTNYPN